MDESKIETEIDRLEPKFNIPFKYKWIYIGTKPNWKLWAIGYAVKPGKWRNTYRMDIAIGPLRIMFFR